MRASLRATSTSRGAAVAPRPLPVAVRRAARRSVVLRAAAPDAPSMLYCVHRWFDALHLPDHPIEDLVHKDAHLIDNTSQACYAGHKAIKHRLQSVHAVMPKLVEASDVADAAHATVAAHWVAGPPSGGGEGASGTYVFRFDGTGLISEITAYADGDESEFLEA